MEKTLYITHCIDTEGPLDETLTATFKRIESLYGFKINPTKKNLLRLQKKEIDLDGLEEEVAHSFSCDILQYLNTWDKIKIPKPFSTITVGFYKQYSGKNNINDFNDYLNNNQKKIDSVL